MNSCMLFMELLNRLVRGFHRALSWYTVAPSFSCGSPSGYKDNAGRTLYTRRSVQIRCLAVATRGRVFMALVIQQLSIPKLKLPTETIQQLSVKSLEWQQPVPRMVPLEMTPRRFGVQTFGHAAFFVCLSKFTFLFCFLFRSDSNSHVRLDHQFDLEAVEAGNEASHQ